jgi:hypothetical protein
MISFPLWLFQILIQQQAMLPHTNLRVKVEIQGFQVVEERSPEGNISIRSIPVHSQYAILFYSSAVSTNFSCPSVWADHLSDWCASELIRVKNWLLCVTSSCLLIAKRQLWPPSVWLLSWILCCFRSPCFVKQLLEVTSLILITFGRWSCWFGSMTHCIQSNLHLLLRNAGFCASTLILIRLHISVKFASLSYNLFPWYNFI